MKICLLVVAVVLVVAVNGDHHRGPACYPNGLKGYRCQCAKWCNIFYFYCQYQDKDGKCPAGYRCCCKKRLLNHRARIACRTKPQPPKEPPKCYPPHLPGVTCKCLPLKDCIAARSGGYFLCKNPNMHPAPCNGNKDYVCCCPRNKKVKKACRRRRG